VFSFNTDHVCREILIVLETNQAAVELAGGSTTAIMFNWHVSPPHRSTAGRTTVIDYPEKVGSDIESDLLLVESFPAMII